MIVLLIALSAAITASVIYAVDKSQDKYREAKTQEREAEAVENERILSIKDKYARLHALLNIEKHKFNIDSLKIMNKANDNINLAINTENFGTHCADEFNSTGQLSPVCKMQGYDEESISNAELLNKIEEEEEYTREMQSYFSMGVLIIIIIVLILYKDEFMKLIK